MKRLLISFTAILLLLSACEKSCLEKRPKNVKPIDWENYNDVYTVYWNYRTLCSEIKTEDLGREIMLTGWVRLPLHNGEDYFSLVSDVAEAGEYPGPVPTPNISIAMYSDSIRYYLASCDLTKKCFIKGRLDISCHDLSGICESKAYPHLLNVGNIYFEE